MPLAMWKPGLQKAEQHRSVSLIRALRLVRFLERTQREWTAVELAARFKVHPKTMRRDIKALQEAEWPIVVKNGGLGNATKVRAK